MHASHVDRSDDPRVCIHTRTHTPTLTPPTHTHATKLTRPPLHPSPLRNTYRTPTNIRFASGSFLFLASNELNDQRFAQEVRSMWARRLLVLVGFSFMSVIAIWA